MKASLFLTVASLICLFLPQANATVVNIREMKDETQIVVANESLQLLANEPPAGELLRTLEGVGVATALTTNEREFRSIPTITTSSDCTEVKELEDSKCEMQVRKISLFDENENYLVCTVTSVFKCATTPVGQPLDLKF